VGEKCPVILSKCRLPCYIYGSFTCRKATTWDRRHYCPSEGRRAEDFFALKFRRLRPSANPANLGTKGQHATSRPPRPLRELLKLTVKNVPNLVAILECRAIKNALNWFSIYLYLFNHLVNTSTNTAWSVD
jgi:hypothetical protein